MKNKLSNKIGLVLLVIILVLFTFLNNPFSVTDTSNNTCNYVTNSCEGYKNCEIIEINNEKVACLDNFDKETNSKPVVIINTSVSSFEGGIEE
jgi:hypothetical protein